MIYFLHIISHIKFQWLINCHHGTESSVDIAKWWHRCFTFSTCKPTGSADPRLRNTALYYSGYESRLPEALNLVTDYMLQ